MDRVGDIAIYGSVPKNVRIISLFVGLCYQ